MIEAAWPGTTVTSGVLKVSIRKIRATLDDDTKSPQFIETARRRGYRFIGQIRTGEKAGGQGEAKGEDTGRLSAIATHRLSGAFRLFDPNAPLPASGVVGREAALAQMQNWSRRAFGGEGGAGLEMAERNEHHRWAVLLRLELAWLHEQAFDFERARELCEQAHDEARKIAHPYTESLSLILLGMAQLGLERREAAFRCFSEVAARLERECSLMDWILRIPLHYGLSRYWMAQGKLARARRGAESLCELASAPGERTYLALSFQTLSEIAMGAQDWEGAEVAIARALTAIEGAKAPLAVWRVCATAARLCEQLGRTAEAADHWRRSAETLNQLAGSLDGADRLRRSLGASPTAQTIRRRAQALRF